MVAKVQGNLAWGLGFRVDRQGGHSQGSQGDQGQGGQGDHGQGGQRVRCKVAKVKVIWFRV